MSSISSDSALKYFAAFLVASIMVVPAYAEQVVKLGTGSLNIGFATDPVTPMPGDQTYLKIRFLDKDGKLYPHIDYIVTIKDGNDIAFSTGSAPLHTAEGSISVPYQFQHSGTYSVTIEIDGVTLQPVPPVTTQFSVTVGGDTQPSGNTTEIKIPTWVKNNAKWWSEGSIDDSTFAAGIQYLIQQGVIKIPPTQSGQTIQNVKIPAWVKNNAGFWSKGQIDDSTFVNGIQWLITNGIIHV